MYLNQVHDALVLLFSIMAIWTSVGSKLCDRQIFRGVSSKPYLLPFLVVIIVHALSITILNKNENATSDLSLNFLFCGTR